MRYFPTHDPVILLPHLKVALVVLGFRFARSSPHLASPNLRSSCIGERVPRHGAIAETWGQRLSRWGRLAGWCVVAWPGLSRQRTGRTCHENHPVQWPVVQVRWHIIRTHVGSHRQSTGFPTSSMAGRMGYRIHLHVHVVTCMELVTTSSLDMDLNPYPANTISHGTQICICSQSSR